MFNEHVWEIYFMVSRSHQAFYFSQTCSLNMSGKIFDTMGVPRGGYISQTCSSNFEIIYPPKEALLGELKERDTDTHGNPNL